MAMFLVTGKAEYYVYIKADSKEEAEEKAKKSTNWCRSMNVKIEDVKATEFGKKNKR